MFVEIFSICDAATDYNGRLNLLGAFEGIAAPKAPIVRERCSIAVRLRFDKPEAGAHEVMIRFLSRKDGRQPAPDMKADMNVKIAEGRESGAFNIVLNISRLTLPDFGVYDVLLFVDEVEKGKIPLLVAQSKTRKQVRNLGDN